MIIDKIDGLKKKVQIDCTEHVDWWPHLPKTQIRAAIRFFARILGQLFIFNVLHGAAVSEKPIEWQIKCNTKLFGRNLSENPSDKMLCAAVNNSITRSKKSQFKIWNGQADSIQFNCCNEMIRWAANDAVCKIDATYFQVITYSFCHLNITTIGMLSFTAALHTACLFPLQRMYSSYFPSTDECLFACHLFMIQITEFSPKSRMIRHSFTFIYK